MIAIEYHKLTQAKRLLDKWRKEASVYESQCLEAVKAGTPNSNMHSIMLTLRACAKELEKELTNEASS